MKLTTQKRFSVFIAVTVIVLSPIIFSNDFRAVALAVTTASNLTNVSCDALFAKFAPDEKSVIANWQTPPLDPAEMRLWDIQSNEPKLLQTFEGESNSFIAVPNFSPDGKFIVVGYNNKAILWNTETGKQAHVFEREHLDSSDLMDAFFSSDGLYIITLGHESANIWETKSGKRIHHFLPETRLISAQLSINNQYLLLTEESGGVTLWDVANENKLYNFSEAFSAVFSPDDKWIISTGYDGLNIQSIANPTQVINLDTELDWRTLKISFDTKYLLAVDDRWEHISIWDVTTGNRIKTFEGKGIHGTFFPQSDDFLIAMVDDSSTSTMQVWNIQSQIVTMKAAFSVGTGDIFDISRDGKWMLGYFAPSVQLRSLTTGEKVFDLC